MEKTLDVRDVRADDGRGVRTAACISEAVEKRPSSTVLLAKLMR